MSYVLHKGSLDDRISEQINYQGQFTLSSKDVGLGKERTYLPQTLGMSRENLSIQNTPRREVYVPGIILQRGPMKADFCL